MDDPNYLTTEIHLICPTCRSPVVITGFHWRLHFPCDDALIASVLEGRLNLSDCLVCKNKVGVLAPFLAVHEDEHRYLFVEGLETFAGVLRNEAGESKVQRLVGKQLTICEDYDQLRNAVLPWVLEHVEDFAVLVSMGDIARVEGAQRLQLATRLRLRLLRMVADGVLTMTLTLPPNIQARICEQVAEADIGAALKKLWPQQVDGLVFQLLQDEFTAAWRIGSLADLEARVKQRVGGPPIVSDRLLQWCVDECVELDECANDAEKFAAGYRTHFLNAVAHLLAGRPNPERAAWASFLWLAFDATRKGQFKDAWLPGRHEAARLVRFEDLWNRCALDLKGDPKEFELSLKDGQALMERFGHRDRMDSMLLAAPIRPMISPENAAQNGERLRTALLQQVKERFRFPLDHETRQAFAVIGAGQVKALLQVGFPTEAARIAQDVVQLALDAGDYAAGFEAGVVAVEHLQRGELFGEAVEILHPLMSIFSRKEVSDQLGRTGAELTVQFWNEAGNVLRQVGERDGALWAYHLSTEFLGLVDEKRRQELEPVIWANEARVFRDQGRYSEARKRLEHVLRQAPDDPLALHSLALLHVQLSEHQLARAYIDRALLNPDVSLDPVRHARLFQTRGMTWAGGVIPALKDLSTALDVAPATAAALVTQICAAIAMAAAGADHPVIERARARLLVVLRGDVDHAGSGREHDLHATALAAYGELLIAQSSNDELTQYLDEWLAPFLAEHEGSTLPWQLLALRGRIAIRLEGLALAWPWFERALARLDADSPVGKEASALLGWLRDKNRFQLELADAAIRLARDSQIDPQALLPVFEFTISRSTSAKLGEASVFDTAARVPELLADAAAHTAGRLHVFAFLEGLDEVQGFVISSGESAPRLVEQARFRSRELRALQSRFAEALGSANPKNLSRLDAKLQDWSTFARTLGPLLAEVAAEDDMIALLPCSSLAGLPLHLCIVNPAGVTLIERNPVVYAGNFGVLLNRPASERAASGRLVVAVAKTDDRDSFQNALFTAAERIAAARPGEARVLLGTDADPTTILGALSSCEEAWFLCHGAYGGRDAGFALCVSDGVVLPPSLLSIDEVPALKRFTLDWTDLESLDHAPAMVVSIACSSGRTLVDAGGSRLGIEQALLAKGAGAIIAPLWDVDQDAALAWLLAFETGPTGDRQSTKAKRCQRAAQTVRKRFGHWYFWGAFSFTGSLFDLQTSEEA